MYTRICFLRFPKETCDQPIISELSRRYEIEFNILKADILPLRDGIMIIELKGLRENVRESLAFLKDMGVKVERLAGKVSRDDEKCFQCGSCTGICPVGALSLQRPEMAVLFDPEKCTGCGLCVPVCPVRAMTVSFEEIAEEMAV
jgi:NAD-dependent dihydropyrimidine dehydrogenase PreA subunit